jgi:transmembrane sensor
MKEFPNRLAYLFKRYYAGEATDIETLEFLSIVKEGKNTSDLSTLLEEVWENSEQQDSFFTKADSDHIFDSIIRSSTDEENTELQTEQFKVSPFYWWRYAAAAILLILGFGVLYKFQSHAVSQQVAVVKPVVTDFPPGGNRATLTLADGSTIILDSASNGVLAKQGNTEVNKMENGQLVYKTDGHQDTKVLAQMNMLSTPKGGQYQIVLPDGSKVWLNSSSSIKFPAVFDKNERKVAVTGEVYFEVVKDKSSPFRVSLGDTEIEVLGTSFNVMAYQDESAFKTTLVEGSVSLTNKYANMLLKPGQQASIGLTGKMIRTEADIDEVTAWKQGLFHFQDSSIQEVMKKAARWYDIEVRYEGVIPVRKFTGKVSMDVNISELLLMLKYAGVNCKIEDKKIIVSS